MISFLISKIRIHPLFWLVIAAGVLTGHFWETTVAFTIVLIHECGHALAAYHFGWTVTSIELLPFGGVAKLDEEEEHSFRQECLVILAGPLQHVWLPFLSLSLTLFPFWDGTMHQLFLSQNNALLLFNMLPIWPLDGGRLLHLCLQKSYPFKSAHVKALLFSAIALISLGLATLYFLPFSANLWVIILFIMLSLYKERRALPFRFLRFLLALSRRDKPCPRVRKLTVQPDTPISSVFSRFYRYTEHSIKVEGKDREAIDGKALASAYFGGRFTGTAIDEYRSE